MVEELKLAIKIDDATIEQSLLKQFANAQKMADKVVLDFKNVNFDDKQIEAKFKEMQKKAGQNPIDLTIGGNTLDMLGQIDKRLTEIFSIGKGKSFTDSSSITSDIGKIENKINELNKKYEESQKKLSFIGSGGIFGEESIRIFEKLLTRIESSLSSIKGILVDVGDGEELSPLLKTIANVESGINKLSSSVKGIGLNMNIDFGSDTEMEAKVQAKISNALQAYQRLFDHIKSLSAGGSLITQKFFDFDINQFDTPMSKLQAYKKFIENMRNEAKSQFNGKDILYSETDKKYWSQASSAMGQVTKAFNEMKASTNTNPLENIFGKTDLTEVIEQLNIIVSKLDEISVSAKGFTEALKNGLNINASVEEIEKLTNRVKELESELAKIKTPTTVATPQESNISSVSTPVIEQQIKSESELNAEIEKRENIIRELQQLQEKLTVHEDFHGNDRYFADQLPTEEEIREADKRIKQLTGTNNIFDVDKLIQDRNEWLSEVKYSLEEYDDLIKANDQKALDEYTTRGLSRIGGAESFFGYEDNNFSIASKFVEEKEKIQNEINNLYVDLDKLDEKMNFDSNNSSVDNTVQSQEKLQSELKETQEQAEKTAQAIKEVASATASTEQKKDAFPDKDVSESVESATNSIKEENNVLEQNTQKVKENTQAKEQNANVNLNKYDKRLDSYNGKVDKYQATIDRFNDGGWTSKTYLENVQAVRDAVKQYATLLDNIKTNQNGIASDEDIQNLDKYEKKIKDTIATVTNMSASEKGYSQLAGQKEIDKINKILRENSAMTSEAKAKIKAYKQELISGNPSVSLEKIHGEIMKIVNAEELAGRAGRSMFDVIKEKAFYGFAAQIGMYFGFNDIVNGFKQVASTVIDLNTQITDLAKVSEATSSQIYDDFSSYADIAKDIGGTISDTISATADWSRNGYNLPDSKELARVALLYKNVGDGIDIDTANESLISTLRGFKMEADEAEKIIDIFNNVSNNEPIDSGGIGEALQRSAASFNAANTSLQESVALISTTNSVIQNPEKVGNMWKVVSMRIRSATSELEQAGEDTDGLVTSTADLQKMIKAMTGYDILESDGKTFKSIYDIVLNISKVWNNLSDLDQSSLLQALAGVTTKMFARIYRNINHRIYLTARVA